MRSRCGRGAAGLSLHSRLTRRFDPQTIREEIDLAAALGADPLVVHPRSLGLESGTWDARPQVVLDEAALATIGGILSYARERSVRLALENGALDLLWAVVDAFPADGCGPGDQLGVCIDVGHANLHRRWLPDPAAAYLSRFADRLLHLHVADNDGTGDDHLMPGDGNVDWRSIADALRHIAYRGKIVLELAGPGGCAAARGAARFLASLGIGSV